MNWKGLKREPWLGIVSEFAWNDWGQAIKLSAGITCAEAKTRTEAVPCTNADRHRWHNLLSTSLIENTVNKLSVRVVLVPFGRAARQGAALSVESSTLWTYNRMTRYEISENSVFIGPLPFAKEINVAKSVTTLFVFLFVQLSNEMADIHEFFFNIFLVHATPRSYFLNSLIWIMRTWRYRDKQHVSNATMWLLIKKKTSRGLKQENFEK